RTETENRRPVLRLQPRDRCDVGVERGSGARKHNQRRNERVPLQPRGDIVYRDPFGRGVDQTDVTARVPKQRRRKRQRVGGLGGAEDVFALLAASLAREGDAVDERWIEEQ